LNTFFSALIPKDKNVSNFSLICKRLEFNIFNDELIKNFDENEKFIAPENEGKVKKITKNMNVT
jgi:hypothetical protein